MRWEIPQAGVGLSEMGWHGIGYSFGYVIHATDDDDDETNGDTGRTQESSNAIHDSIPFSLIQVQHNSRNHYPIYPLAHPFMSI